MWRKTADEWTKNYKNCAVFLVVFFFLRGFFFHAGIETQDNAQTSLVAFPDRGWLSDYCRANEAG